MSLGREIKDFLGAFNTTYSIGTKMSGAKKTPAKDDPTNPNTPGGKWVNQQAGAAPAAPGVTSAVPLTAAYGAPGPAVSDVDPTDQVSQDAASGDNDYADGGDVLPAYQQPGGSLPPPALPQYEQPGGSLPFDPNAQPQEPPIPLPPAKPEEKGKGAVDTSKGKRKALDDQTRTEAYDPDQDGPGAVPTQASAPAASTPTSAVPLANPPMSTANGGGDGSLSTNDARSDLERALHGAMTFAQDTFHQNDPNDPHKAGGHQALFSGVGAAPPEAVQAMDAKINKGVAADPQLYSIRRLEAIYRYYSMNGKSAEANKAAFELVQYTAGIAAQWGDRAAKQAQGGDMQGAVRSLVEGYNYIPDGRKMTVNGNTATITDARTGKPVDQFQFTPQQVFGAAMGLGNRSLYWNTLINRVGQAGAKPSNRTASQQDLDAARAENIRARTKRLQAGPATGNGHSAGFNDLVNKIEAEEPNSPKDSAPPQQAAPAPAQGDGDDDPTQGEPGVASGESNATLDSQDAPVGQIAQPPPAARPGPTVEAGKQQDQDYQAWLQKNHLREDPDYDMRGAFAAGEQPDARGHMTDQYKKPTHPTFSDESVYNNDKNRGGHWTQTGDGKWSFAPGPANLKNGGIERVKKYLAENDPDVTLLPPTGGKDVTPEKIPATADHPGFEPHYEAPDNVPDIKIAHDGDKYVPGSDVTPANQFDEEAPKPNPYHKYEADAAKVPGKEGVALRQLIQKKAAAYDATIKDYNTRKKAFDASEKTRVTSEGKAAGKDLQKAMAVYDQDFKPNELQKAKKDVNDAWDDAAKKAVYPPGSSFDDPTSKEAKAAADTNKDAFASSIFGDKTVSADKLKDVAVSLMTSNPNLTAEKAVRLVHQLSGIDPQDATKRTYTPVGHDVTASKNVVVKPADGGPYKFAPVHIRQDAYNDLTSIVQQRLKAGASRGKQAATDAVTKAENDTSGDSQKIVGKAKDLAAGAAKNVIDKATTIKPSGDRGFVGDLKSGAVDLGQKIKSGVNSIPWGSGQRIEENIRNYPPR